MDKTTNVTHSSISPSSVSTQFAKFCESATDQQILNLAPANLDYIQTGQKIYFSPDGKIGPDSYLSRMTTSHEYRNLDNLSAFIVRLEKAFVNSNSFYELDDIREKLEGAKEGLTLLRADYEKSYPEGDAGRAPRLNAIDAALKNIDTLNTTFDSKFHLKSPDLGSSQLGSVLKCIKASKNIPEYDKNAFAMKNINAVTEKTVERDVKQEVVVKLSESIKTLGEQSLEIESHIEELEKKQETLLPEVTKARIAVEANLVSGADADAESEISAFEKINEQYESQKAEIQTLKSELQKTRADLKKTEGEKIDAEKNVERLEGEIKNFSAPVKSESSKLESSVLHDYSIMVVNKKQTFTKVQKDVTSDFVNNYKNEPSLQNVNNSLNNLSKLQPGEKCYFDANGTILSEGNTYTRSVFGMYDASRDIKNLAFFSEWLSDRFDSFMPYDEAKQIVGSIDGALTGLQNLLQTYTGDASKSEHADIIKGAMNLLIEARTKMSLQHENYKHVDMEGVSKNIITSTSRASSPEDQFKAIKYLINCHGVFSQDGGVTQSESLLGSLYNTLKSSNLTPFERECVLSEVILGTMTLQKKIDNVNNEIEVHRQMLKSATTDGQKGKIESEINTLEAKIEVLTVEQGNFNENVALLKSYIEVTEKGGVPTAEQRANILAKVANKFPQNFTANAIKSELSKDGELKEASKSLLSQGYGLVKDNKDAIGDVVLAVLTTGPAGGAAAIAKHTLDKQTLKVFEGLATYIQGPEKQ